MQELDLFKENHSGWSVNSRSKTEKVKLRNNISYYIASYEKFKSWQACVDQPIFWYKISRTIYHSESCPLEKNSYYVRKYLISETVWNLNILKFFDFGSNWKILKILIKHWFHNYFSIIQSWQNIFSSRSSSNHEFKIDKIFYQLFGKVIVLNDDMEINYHYCWIMDFSRLLPSQFNKRGDSISFSDLLC